MIIGISGKRGSGKTTVARELATGHGYRIVSFAAPLKEMCIKLFGCDRKAIYGTDKQKNRATNVRRSYWNLAVGSRSQFPHTDDNGSFLTHRELMQGFGSVIRDVMSNAWIQYALHSIASHDAIVIDDVRYTNEADAIRERGGVVVRLDSPDVSQDAHPSETELDAYSGFALRLLNDRSVSPGEIASRILAGCVK